MKLSLVVLSTLLLLSIALNLYFISIIVPSSQQDTSAETILSTTMQTSADGGTTAIQAPQAEEALADNEQQSTSPDADEKQQWLSQVGNWLKLGEFVRARTFIQQYLREHPQDNEFLLLEGDLIAATENISIALAHYYSMLELPLSEQQKLQVNSKIDSLAVDTINKLKAIRSWDILANFVEPLWQIAPYERLYIVTLAEAYAEQQRLSLMDNVLASLPDDDPDVLRVRHIIDEAYRHELDEQSDSFFKPEDYNRAVSLIRSDDHFLVRANLQGNNLALMLDTGASSTVISQRVFNSLRKDQQADFIGRYMVNTAGGQLEAPIYQFRRLSVADYAVKDVAVIVLPMENFSQADGLLGMNFLREFEFKIDQQNALLYLK
jgi:clan AA aspartic protease (TIGR02281 family)